jgi:arylsulfatase
VLAKSWNVLSWLEETQRLEREIPVAEIPWESLLDMPGRTPVGLPWVRPLPPEPQAVDLAVMLKEMPRQRLTGLAGQMSCPVPSLLSLQVPAAAGGWTKLASLLLPASPRLPAAFHFDLSGNRDLQQGKLDELHLQWAPAGAWPQGPASLALSQLRILAGPRTDELASAVIASLSDAAGDHILHSRSLLIPPGRSVRLRLRGSDRSRIVFRGRSAAAGRSRIEFQRKRWLGFRTMAAFDLDGSWRSETLRLDSFSGVEEELRIRNPSAATAALSAFYFRPDDRPPPRSVVLLVFDSLRRDALGIYGYPRPTSPALDAFARGHVLFQKALSAGPQTPWSVLNMLASSWGPFAIAEAQKVPAGVRRLPGEVSRLGRLSVGISENVQAGSLHDLQRGYDLFFELRFDPQRSRRERDGASGPGMVAAVRGIVPLLAQTGFFFYGHFWKPHIPYAPSQEGFKPFAFAYRGAISAEGGDGNSFLDRPWSQLASADRRQIRALYDGGVRDCDTAFAAIRRMLEDAGIMRRTLLAVTADHGEAFGEHEGYRAYAGNAVSLGNSHLPFLFQVTAAVPLIVSFPGDRPLAVGEPVSLVDLAPSFCEFLGLAPAMPFQGESFFPLLAGAKRPQRRLYATYRRDPQLAVALFAGDRKAVRYYTQQEGRWRPAESAIYDISRFSEDRELSLPAGERRLWLGEVDAFLERQLALIEHGEQAVSRSLTAEQRRQLRTLGYVR